MARILEEYRDRVLALIADYHAKHAERVRHDPDLAFDELFPDKHEFRMQWLRFEGNHPDQIKQREDAAKAEERAKAKEERQARREARKRAKEQQPSTAALQPAPVPEETPSDEEASGDEETSIEQQSPEVEAADQPKATRKKK